MADWAFDSGSPAIQASAAAAGGSDEAGDRTSVITGRLKTLYRKTVLPVEKRFKYDYFYESPFLSDSEFDGMSSFEYSLFGGCLLESCRLSLQIPAGREDSHSIVLFSFSYHSQASGNVDRAVQCR